MNNKNNLSGKNILITGASSGIGEKIALSASECGAKVIMIARDEEKLKSVQKNLINPGAYYMQDLTMTGEIKSLIDQIVDENGKIDGFVHCAGIAASIPLKSLKVEMLHQGMLIHVYAFVEMVKNVTRKKNFNANGGSIVGISSVSSQRGYKGKTVYCAAKGAMDSAVRAMSTELASKRIRVNTVSPGFIKTRMYEWYVERQGDDAAKYDIAKQPLGLGETKDVASAVLFLLSDLSKFITGTTIPVDGGRLATD